MDRDVLIILPFAVAALVATMAVLIGAVVM
jgi:hypothetical protein